MIRGRCDIVADGEACQSRHTAAAALGPDSAGPGSLVAVPIESDVFPGTFEANTSTGTLRLTWHEPQYFDDDEAVSNDESVAQSRVQPPLFPTETTLVAIQWLVSFDATSPSSPNGAGCGQSGAKGYFRRVHFTLMHLEPRTAAFDADSWRQLGNIATSLRRKLPSPSLTLFTIAPSKFFDKRFSSHEGTSSSDAQLKSTLKSFARQESAFRHCDALSSVPLKCFSFESADMGRRRFITVSPEEFVDRYLAIPLADRHVYEIIREGYPCRGYFDIEFATESNVGVDGNALVRRLVLFICWKFYDLFGIEIDERDFINLDSSNETKFSQHLIMNIVRPSSEQSRRSGVHPDTSPVCGAVELESLRFGGNDDNYVVRMLTDNTVEYLFPSNAHVGSFVSRLVSDMLIENECPLSPAMKEGMETDNGPFEGGITPKPQFLEFWVWDKNHTSRINFVDLCVYSRNRAFRLVSSCKYGKATSLSVNQDNFYNTRIREEYSKLNELAKSIPGNVRRADLRDRMHVALSLTAVVPLGITGQRVKALLAKCNAPEEIMNSYTSVPPYMLCDFNGVHATSEAVTNKRFLAKIRNADTAGAGLQHIQPGLLTNGGPSWMLTSTDMFSPFGSLDDFISRHFLAEGGARGRINGWCLAVRDDAASNADNPEGSNSVSAKITYQVIGNKFCRRIGRPHRSNHIMIEVNMSRCCAYQRCWDPDCRDYRSNEVPVPAPLLPSKQEVLDAVLDAKLQEFLKNNPGI